MHSNPLILDITLLIIELAIIILASWLCRYVAQKIKLPPVVVYIFAGIILGPFLLGSIPIADIFPHGLFPKAAGTIPVSAYLYSLSALASIILLYVSGLETDMVLFIKYSFVGSLVGLGGLVVSFAGGYTVSVLLLDHHFLHPTHLFLATIATATSVGISSAILSAKQKINSPEGLTTLSAAVLDDVLGIVTLAIVIALAESLMDHTGFTSALILKIIVTSVKAVGLWLTCTLLGVIFSRKIGRGMKKIFKDSTNITVVSLGLAFLLGGIFEIVGLSMVIGAYIFGLTLSNTDLSYVIQEKIAPLTLLFTPIFFIITGMIINIQEILQWDTIIFGLIYALVCIITKIVGAGLPSLGLGFNMLGALRIGFGMVPRGEIALIITGIGIGFNIIDDKTFGAVLIMILVSSIVGPYFLNKLFEIDKPGTKVSSEDEPEVTEIDLNNEALKRLILVDFIQLLEDENFYINRTFQKGTQVYHIRKDNMFVTLTTDAHNSSKLIFHSDKDSISFVKTALYEASANLAESSQYMKDTLDPKKIISSETSSHKNISLAPYLSSSLVSLQLKANDKEGIIREMIDMLEQDDLLINKELFIQEILEREKTFSTGMQEGIAIPHAKTNAVKRTSLVIGIKPEGIDFASLDGKPSNIFILIASAKDTPHLGILTAVSTRLNSEEFRLELLKSNKKATIVQMFS